MAKEPTTDRGRRTRERIVVAAAAVVAEKGARGASLDDVCAAAPASRSQLYHYFDDKADLLHSVAQATNEAVLGGQRELFDGLSSWDGLRRWADALVEVQYGLHGRRGCPIATLLGQIGESDEGVRSTLASGFDRWEAGIRAGLQAMADSGELRAEADLDLLATSTLASLQGGLVLTQASREPERLRRALDGALALIERDLVAR